MTTKVAAISMVKNECDIIELFVKINTRSVHHIYIIDHNSTDGTPKILQNLMAIGYPITVTKNNSLSFDQSEITTALARRVADLNEYDYIVPLDADEFIHCNNQYFPDLLKQQIQPGECARLQWLTYVPIKDNFNLTPRPLFDNFRMRDKEPEQYYKVVISNELAKKCTLCAGNHFVTLNGEELQANTLDAFLQHVPVRTSHQITAKALTGSHRLSITSSRNKMEGSHWDQMAEKLRKQSYKLTVDELTSIASQYAIVQDSHHETISNSSSALRIGNAEDTIEFIELSKTNPLINLDNLASELCLEIHTLRRQLSKSTDNQSKTNIAAKVVGFIRRLNKTRKQI